MFQSFRCIFQQTKWGSIFFTEKKPIRGGGGRGIPRRVWQKTTLFPYFFRQPSLTEEVSFAYALKKFYTLLIFFIPPPVLLVLTNIGYNLNSRPSQRNQTHHHHPDQPVQSDHPDHPNQKTQKSAKAWISE